MSPLLHFDHVGTTVRDLDTVTAFFAGMGFETEGASTFRDEPTIVGRPRRGIFGSYWRDVEVRSFLALGTDGPPVSGQSGRSRCLGDNGQ